MYLPNNYQKKDNNFFLQFVQAHPFATLVSMGNRLIATHLPFLTTGTADDFVLYSHLARHNEQHQYLKDGTEVLLIFQGAHAYVSSSWYKEKNISTWDYSAVHINASIKMQTQEELEASLRELVHVFEKDQSQPLMYDDIPPDMLQEHLPQITGFWCKPKHIQGIAKFHQGYPAEDVKSVVQHLEGQKDENSFRLAEEIKKEHGL